jgi:hypothetical protein
MVSLLVTVCSANFHAQDSQNTQTAKYQATINDVKYEYGAAEPVVRLRSGDVLDSDAMESSETVSTVFVLKGLVNTARW